MSKTVTNYSENQERIYRLNRLEFPLSFCKEFYTVQRTCSLFLVIASVSLSPANERLAASPERIRLSHSPHKP